MSTHDTGRARRAHLGQAASARASGLLELVERVTHLTTNGLVAAGLAAGGFVLSRRFQSAAIALLTYGVVVVLVIAYALGYRKPGLTAERSDLPTRVRQGQQVGASIRLTATRRVTTVVVEETVPTALGRPVRMPVPSLAPGEVLEQEHTLAPTRRGVYAVGPLVASWSDPFGLTRHRMVLREEEPLLVHPSTDPVTDRVISREWEDPPIRPPVSKPWPTGFEFYGMRDYVNGDDPRRIVWRKTAQALDLKTGEGRYLVRESEQGITDRVTIVLDNDAEAHSPGPVSDTFELAIRAVASIGAQHLHDGFALTVEANHSALGRELRGPRARIPLLDELARADTVKDDATKPLGRLLSTGLRNAHLVVVTPSLSANVATRLRLLVERGGSIVVVLLIHDDMDPLSLHRAGTLQCNVVELAPGVAIDRAFTRGIRMAARL